MNIQKACEILEDLSEKEANVNTGKLTIQEFLALQQVLLELQAIGKYKIVQDDKVDDFKSIAELTLREAKK